MKKFKIVEEGRFLTNQALAQVQGGGSICISTSTYRICGSGSKTVCNVVSISTCMTNLLTCGGNLKVCGNGQKAVCGGSMSIIVNN